MPEFPSDEFDDAAGQRGPVGVHRKRKRVLKTMVVPLLIFAIGGGALAYGVVVYLWRAQGNEGVPPLSDVAIPTITATVIDDPSATLEPTVSVTPSETPSPTPTETAEPVHLEASVFVLNGAGISGLAARNQDVLAAAGFTAITAGNVTGTKPAANTVRYADAAYETTAQKVAEVLGIGTVEQGVVTDGNIAVILVTDPAA